MLELGIRQGEQRLGSRKELQWEDVVEWKRTRFEKELNKVFRYFSTSREKPRTS